ncbi:putative glycosyltransferase [Dorcoceras hygrometricum]|uniref:Putative glycosyltransferase n=1 Tax=Dorcoceras hygrometricum TaxID=472368 RepID=A0A2Z7B6J0_9LAMI|nr:putative glycosyltransferase [Dorcoceras hygrometricum]
MDGRCKRSVCSWWKTTPSSTRLLGFMLPLMVVFGVVGLMGSKYSSYSPPWIRSSLFPGYGSNGAGSVQENIPTSGDGGEALELWRTVVSGGEKEEALSADYNLNRSAAPPLAVVATRTVPHVVEEEESSIISINEPSNETLVLSSSPKIKRKFSNLEILEARLQRARASVRDANNGNGTYDPDYIPNGPIYRNPVAFHRSYMEMEKQLKVYVYGEGEQPIFHNGPCGSIYSMEGNFIYKMETTKFRTRDPETAHVFFLPFSVASIVHFIHNRTPNPKKDHWLPMKQTVRDYVDLVANKYPYWNRSLGADHFMLACHDWGPELSKSVPWLFKNSIRALCNANMSEGFQPSKDVSIPEINLPGRHTNGLIGGPSPSKRPTLVFFAGGLHGPIRPILLDHWENKDPDVQVHKYLPKDVSYLAMMRQSRYCICPSGYEVASPRMVEALYTGCVPVLIKDGYVPPFSDVLNWKAFSVEISVADIPSLKQILSGISTRQYIRMQKRGVQARRHFEVNLLPKRYDVFHMTLHSIWLRRLNVRLHGIQDS